MNYDVFETQLYTDPYTGVEFLIEFSFDNDTGPPQNECDGHGVIVSYDAHNLEDEDEDETLERQEEKIRMSLLRKIDCQGSRRYSRLYYDVWESLKTARCDWCAPDATVEEVQAAVDRDYEFINGWYDSDWWYCVVSAIPLLPAIDQSEGEQDVEARRQDELAEHLGGVEWGAGTYDAEKRYINEVVRDIVAECNVSTIIGEYQQMTLPLEVPSVSA